ncbi:MAG TPA: hypothetical protein VFI31_18515 [Pirellulales bacterium]|nr:hypothetical protein [Pirellulales bacterium]
MFAGAAREAVFSNPDVIRRVQTDFVPVALKAGLINMPPDDDEGRLYREIGRSKPAPQGICVVNSAGKVLNWALMFDDDQSVVDFLDHALQRFAKYPDASRPFAAERYMRFPSQKLDDMEDSGKVPPVPEQHAEGKRCPAKPRVARGTVVGRLYGHALDADDMPVADTTSQEHYVEDRFEVPVAVQEAIAKALADAGAERFPLADEVARLLVSHAFLGQLDVNPLGGLDGGKGAQNELKQCEFWAQTAGSGRDGSTLLRIEGSSHAEGMSGDGRNDDGRLWRHDVKLNWHGYVEMKRDRMICLLLVAHGRENLKWANLFQDLQGRADVTHLPGGHAIDLSCGVRYGIIGEPVADEDALGEEAAVANGTVQLPTGIQRQLAEVLGGEFVVFRDRVQDELRLSKEQKQKLSGKFLPHVEATMGLFERIKDLQPADRERQLHEHRHKSAEKLSAELKAILNADQQSRLFQLQLQQAGAFALLGQNEAFLKLNITDEQRKQFTAVVQEMQKKIEPLMKEAQSGGNPQKIGPRILKIRKEHEDRIEAILSDVQNKQWKQMLGKPLDLGD